MSTQIAIKVDDNNVVGMVWLNLVQNLPKFQKSKNIENLSKFKFEANFVMFEASNAFF